GTVDPADRLDAAGLVRSLDAVARRLPPPAPLPLSPVEQLPLPEQESRDSTTAFSPLAAAPLAAAPLAAAPLAAAPLAAAPLAAAPLAAARPAIAAPQPAAPPPPVDRRHQHWRLPWIAIGVIAVAAAVVAWLLAVPALTPASYAVPRLVNQPWATVQHARYPHFKVVEHQVREGDPTGQVLRQRPAAGTRHRPGTISVDVSIGFPLVTVPDLSKLTLDQAQQRLLGAQLTLAAHVNQAFSNDVKAGLVMGWTPTGSIPEHSEVTVTQSVGPQVVPMPAVTGQPVAQAEATLRSWGLTDQQTQ